MDINMPKLASSVTMDVPPKLTSGKGTPTTGSIPDTIPALTSTVTKKVRRRLPARRQSMGYSVRLRR